MMIFTRTRTVFFGKYAFQWSPAIEQMIFTQTEQGSLPDFLRSAKSHNGIEPKTWVMHGIFICNGLSLKIPNTRSTFVQMRRNSRILHALRAFQKHFKHTLLRRKQALATMMAFHPRLGASSVVSKLDENTVRMCLGM